MTADGAVGVMSSREVCQATGATYRQLDYWTTAGWIRPLRACRGDGHSRWTDEDRDRAIAVADTHGVAEAARRYGVSRSTISSWRRGMRRDRALEDLPPGTPGSGYVRAWDPADVARIAAMARMARAGIPPAVAHRALESDGDIGHGVRCTLDDAPYGPVCPCHGR